VKQNTVKLFSLVPVPSLVPAVYMLMFHCKSCVMNVTDMSLICVTLLTMIFSPLPLAYVTSLVLLLMY